MAAIDDDPAPAPVLVAKLVKHVRIQIPNTLDIYMSNGPWTCVGRSTAVRTWTWVRKILLDIFRNLHYYYRYCMSHGSNLTFSSDRHRNMYVNAAMSIATCMLSSDSEIRQDFSDPCPSPPQLLWIAPGQVQPGRASQCCFR